jgi:FG-GAP-like repeat/Putative Ig domain
LAFKFSQGGTRMSRASRSFALSSVFFIAAAAGCGRSAPPLSVSLSPSSSQTVDQTQTVSISATLTNDRSAQGVSWTLTGSGSLSGATAASVTYNSPTGNLAVAQEATVVATSVADRTKTASVKITVNPFPQFGPLQTLAHGTVGTPYSQTIALSGGTAPFEWSIYNGPILTGSRVGGAVPDGLNLNPATGTISGTPTAGGTWFFEAVVRDAAGITVSDNFLSIQINSNPVSANPVPFLNQPLTPSAVSPGSPGLTLNLYGTGFVPGAAVNFNGVPLATTFVDSAHLNAAVPAANLATAGTALVTVVNPQPGGGRSNPAFFQTGAPEASVTFVKAPNSPLAIPEPSGVVASDFNEDGKPDLAIAGAISVYVLLGTGDGTFAPADGSPLPVPSPPYDDFPTPHTGPALAVGDFNRSGHAGLAVGLFQNLAAAILLGKGDGTFSFADTLARIDGQPTMSLTAADFNGDGDLDLVAANTLNGVSPVVLLGYGHGAFNAVSQDIEISTNSSAAGDFNGDGILDVVLGGSGISGAGNGGISSLLLGRGDGTFTQGPSLTANGFLAVGDFNGDGQLDLAVTEAQHNTVTIFLGDGNGTFTTAQGSPMTAGSEPWAILAADFNNDGKLDLAIANYGDGTVTLLLGNGDGTFTPSAGSPYPVRPGASGLAVADFNGDGKLDLAVVNASDGNGTVSILLQQ